VVNAAPTAKEGNRVRALVSALVGAGITGGYLASARLREVHWQAGGRPSPEAETTVAGESVLFVDPAEIPAHADVARLGQALAAAGGPRGWLDELMAILAAYSGLRWGELAALTITQIDQAARVITVDRKVVEIGGRLFTETPKNRKRRRTIYPRRRPPRRPRVPAGRRRSPGTTALADQPRVGKSCLDLRDQPRPQPAYFCQPLLLVEADHIADRVWGRLRRAVGAGEGVECRGGHENFEAVDGAAGQDRAVVLGALRHCHDVRRGTVRHGNVLQQGDGDMARCSFDRGHSGANLQAAPTAGVAAMGPIPGP
jgi:hypothetical protein